MGKKFAADDSLRKRAAEVLAESEMGKKFAAESDKDNKVARPALMAPAKPQTRSILSGPSKIYAPSSSKAHI
eukprot:9444752-Karenia_brevis.AAC.1